MSISQSPSRVNAPTATIPALQELRSRPQWVCYCLEPDKSDPTRLTKVPYNARTGYKAASTKSKDWSTHDQAARALKNAKNVDGKPFDGIGFVFNRDMTGIDLDHCIDERGQIDAWAQEIIHQFDSYAEISPSGAGVHLFVHGLVPLNEKGKHAGRKIALPGMRHPKAAIEMYSEGRYFTVTEKHLAGSPIAIEDRIEQLTAIHAKIYVPKPQEQKSTARTSPAALSLSDNELIDIAHKAKNSAKFAALWRGDTSEYQGDESRADAALCLMLAFYTRKDASQVDSLFRRSGLYREKWDSSRGDSTYGQITIERAIGQCLEVFAPASSVNGHIPNTSNNGHNGNTDVDPPPVSKAPYPFRCTDLGNAERFAARYKHMVRWCETWNSWIVFDGKCWESDKTGRVDQLAKAVVRSIYHEVAEAEDKELFEKLKKHAGASESNRAIRAMLDRAKSELPITPDQFNTHLHLLNCRNGTLDLRTGELHPHNPLDFLTRCVKVNYNPLATCTGWETFIHTIFSGDQGLIAFMQQSLGMSLSGDISEQCLFICHGEGSNGKTTMIEIVRKIMHDYGLAANIETFQMRKNEAIRNDIAELYGARLVSASENVIGSRLNEAFIKKATGGEPLRARRLHENEFEFMPEFTIWIAVNHKPVVKDTTKGMWRRVHFVPFLVTFDEQAADKHFGKKLLAAEREGILTWLVKGCMAWYQQERLIVPETVRKATQAYRAEMDIVGNFLANECDLSGTHTTPTKTKELLERYETWCNQLGETFNAKDLKRGLNERGYHSKRGHGGAYVYSGIGLLPITEDTSRVNVVNVGEGKSEVISRETETRQKTLDLPSPTFTTFTQPSPITENDYYRDMASRLINEGKHKPVEPCEVCKTLAWYPAWAPGATRVWKCATCNPEIVRDV